MLRLFASLLAATLSMPSFAQGSRAGTWELGFSLFDSQSVHLDGQGGSSLDIDGDVGYGAVGAYNITERIAVIANIDWSEPGYRATLPLDGSNNVATIDANLSVASLQIGGVFYFSTSTFSPYVELRGGWTRVDSNIATGPPLTDCWWDPWWGYVCRQFFDTYHETLTSRTAAFGVRWDVTPETLLKVSWATSEVNTSSRVEDYGSDVFRAEFSWKF